MMDGFTAEMGGGEGVRSLTITIVEFITSKQKGTPGLKLTFSSGGDHKMFKTMYHGKMFNRFVTSFVSDCKLNPRDLEEASRNGYGESWLIDNLTGKSIDIYCGYGEPNQEGKKYLEPMSTAEKSFKDWIASQNNTPRAPAPNEPPIDSYQNMANDGFTDDSVPF